MVSGVSGDDVNVGDRAETHTDAHVTANRSSRCPARLDWTGSTPGDTVSRSEPQRVPSEGPDTYPGPLPPTVQRPSETTGL